MNKQYPTRACDGCKACCFTHQVTSLTTEITGIFEHCPHECQSGCRIYGNHPPACKEYRCSWLKGHIGGPNDRPDKLGLVIDQYDFQGVKNFCYVAMETFPGAARQKRTRKFLRQLSETDIVVVTGPTLNITVYGPPHKSEEMKQITRFLQEGKELIT